MALSATAGTDFDFEENRSSDGSEDRGQRTWRPDVESPPIGRIQLSASLHEWAIPSEWGAKGRLMSPKGHRPPKPLCKAPLMQIDHSKSQNMWHTRSSLSSSQSFEDGASRLSSTMSRLSSVTASSASRSRCWTPLADGWRSRMSTSSGPVRLNADDAKCFMDGCVPDWSKDAKFRMLDCLAHEMSWIYYDLRRHKDHPTRKAVGEHGKNGEIMPGYRASSVANSFNFWRDCRPPFQVMDLCLAEGLEASSSRLHRDGQLYVATYKCGLDYQSEHSWNDTNSTAAGVYDNYVTGMATVRVPPGYPRSSRGRRLIVESWGKPRMGWPSSGTYLQTLKDFLPASVADGVAEQIDKRPSVQIHGGGGHMFAKEQAIRKANGLRAKEQLKQRPKSSAEERAGTAVCVKPRSFTLRTAAAGFVRFAG